MSEFIARVRAQLDMDSIKPQLESLTKKRTIKVNVVASGTALQKQIESMVKTQQTALSAPIKSMTKAQQAYSDWWNKELGKSSNAYYGKSQQFKFFDDYLKKAQATAAQAQIIQKRISQGFLDVETSGIKKTLNNYTGVDSSTLKAAEASYQRLITLKKELQTGKSSDPLGKTLSDKDIVSKYQQYLSVLEKVRNQSKTLANEMGGVVKPFNTLDAVTASNRTLMWLKNNSKAAKEYGVALQDIAAKQRNATSPKELATYNKEFKNVVSQAQLAGKTGRTFWGEMGSGFKRIGQFVGAYRIWMMLVQTLKKMATAVKDVDDAMTELRKVTDAPMSQVAAYFDEATESAKKYGQTISDVIKNTADWQRLGYNLIDAKQLSDMTTLYQNVGDNMTQESASTSMVSTLQGFQLAADQAEHIVDAFNEVDLLAS